ncbi:Transcription initiation factor TFIID subunit 2 [Kluyveromyces marxianus]
MVQMKSTPKTPGSYPATEQQFGPQFKVAHQRVQIDVDLSKNCIVGTTEMIIMPLTPHLEYIALDCKNMRIKDIIFENRRLDNFVHDDPYKKLSDSYLNNLEDDVLYNDNGIEQSHLLRKKFSEFNHNPEGSSKSQLLIKVPSSVKIMPHDVNTLAAYLGNSVGAPNITPSLKNTPSTFPGDTIYTPLTLRVDYELDHPHTGVCFDTVSSEPHLWNAYTTNSELNSSVSHWLPCIDSLDEKCTWELEISVPKRVKDIGTTKVVGARNLRKRSRRDRRSNMSSGAVDDDDDEDEEEDEEDEEEEDGAAYNEFMNSEITVVCSEMATKKVTAHPMDMAKKTVSFQIFTPVAPHHIGWAVGAFRVLELPSILHADEDEDIDELKMHQQEQALADDTRDEIPIFVYTLPTPDMDEKTVLNSTLVCQEIMDFYSKEFGSYPFTSYSLVFLPTLTAEYMDFTSATFFNSRILYPPDVIDLIFPTTNTLAWGLANQWSGVNITPLELNDLWCVIGMAGYMVSQLIRKLMGLNEYKYRIKMAAEAIVEQDWEKQPIGSYFDSASLPVSTISNDLSFIKLKAPMVLFILDRRMTKTERSFGMSRVLPKIYLQAMSGELTNNSLSSAHFQRVCERVNKNRLETFFKQWVYGSGVPIFRITQRFNKKRMAVEMGIRQVQMQELGVGKIVGEESFHSSAMEYLRDQEKYPTQVFTGSMTIRIHEADGTPYEHIVELKDVFTKLDIQYNTKYKRLKRRRKVNKVTKEAKDEVKEDMNDEDNGNEDIVLINCMGDVLTSKDDCNKWSLTDPITTSEGDDLQQQNEAFEWIRIDADFEWICKVHINQPDYMFASQLQQDRDVEAQIESVRFFEDLIINSSSNSLVYSSILTRTAMDPKYFHGVRVAACRALSKFVIENNEPTEFTGGPRHLIKIFRELFCYNDSNIPKNNDFSDYQKYMLQKSIPKFLALVRNDEGVCPSFVKQFLLDVVRYNDNSGNIYNDTFYVSQLLESLVNCTLSDVIDENHVQEVMNEIQRFYNLDQWMPSYQHLIATSIKTQRLKLSVHGLYHYDSFSQLLSSTILDNQADERSTVCHSRDGKQDAVLEDFKILLVIGGIKNKEVLKYFFENLCFHPDPYIRTKLVDVFIGAIDLISAKFHISDLEDDIEYMINEICPSEPDMASGSIVVEDFTKEIAQRKETQMRSSIHGMISLIRRRFKDYQPLRTILWDVLHSPLLNVYQRKRLFDAANVIYQLYDAYNITLPTPRDKKLICKNIGNNHVVIKREGILKVHIAPLKLKSEAKTTPTTIKISFSKKTSHKAAAPTATTAAAITSSPAPKPKAKPSSVAGKITKVGSLPLRFVKISTATNSVHVSAVPHNPNVSIVKSTRRILSVKLKFPQNSEQKKEHQKN